MIMFNESVDNTRKDLVCLELYKYTLAGRLSYVGYDKLKLYDLSWEEISVEAGYLSWG